MAQIVLTKEQLTELEKPDGILEAIKYKNVTLRLNKQVLKSAFTLNRVDLQTKDQGLCTGKFKQFKFAPRITYIMAEIKVSNLRGFKGELWAPINFCTVLD